MRNMGNDSKYLPGKVMASGLKTEKKNDLGRRESGGGGALWYLGGSLLTLVIVI